jgi:outer membrane murein-binding lipoprotein Lpp
MNFTGRGGAALLQLADLARVGHLPCLELADLGIGAGQPFAHTLELDAELPRLAPVLVTLLPEGSLNAAALRQLSSELGELFAHIAILPLERNSARRQVCDMAAIPALFATQAEQLFLGNGQRLSRLRQTLLCALEFELELTV